MKNRTKSNMSCLILFIFSFSFLAINGISQTNLKAEYFIDSDPGFGMGIPLVYQQSTQIDSIEFTLSTNQLQNGFHKLLIRSQDGNGNWSHCNTFFFYKEKSLEAFQLTDRAEFFIDNDPGFGLAKNISIQQGVQLADTSFLINTDTLSLGFHEIFTRTKDNSGNWSLSSYRSFYKDPLPTSSPNIVSCEFFVDTDPGVRNATNINLQTGVSDTLFAFSIDNTLLPKGFHNIFVRAFDQMGQPGLTNYKSFFNDYLDSSLYSLKKAEYFFDTDPGFSHGSVLGNLQHRKDSIVSNISTVSLLPGWHQLHIRACSQHNFWGQNLLCMIYKESADSLVPTLKGYEYFVDFDPGFSSGSDTSFSSSLQKDSVVFTFPVSTLNAGFHNLHLRAKNNFGRWGLTAFLPFYKQTEDGSLSIITGSEYFIDTDPGIGFATAVPSNTNSGNDSVLFSTDASSFPVGTHYLVVRSKNADGKWTLSNIATFCRGADANFTSNATCFGNVSLLLNSTSESNASTIYNWDINNDGTIDFTAHDSVYYTFPQSGTHYVKLIAINPGSCSDTIVKAVIVDPVYSLSNPVTICQGQDYSFNGHTYSIAGIYNDTLYSISGCDSIIVTNLHYFVSSVNGAILYSNGFIGSGDAEIKLYKDGINGHHQMVDSVLIGPNGSFAIQSIADGNYYLYSELINESFYPNVKNTYLGNTYKWQDASVLHLNCGIDTNVVIQMFEIPALSSGSGHLKGKVQLFTTFPSGKTIGEPIPGAEIYVELDPDDEPIANSTTDTSGYYNITGLPEGTYSMYVDIPGFPLVQTYAGLPVSLTDTLYDNLNFYVDTTILSSGIYTNDFVTVNNIKTGFTLKIFPNPVEKFLSIETMNLNDKLFVEIVDMNAKLLFKSTVYNHSKIDMSLFPQGMYLIRLQSENTVILKKILKQ